MGASNSGSKAFAPLFHKIHRKGTPHSKTKSTSLPPESDRKGECESRKPADGSYSLLPAWNLRVRTNRDTRARFRVRFHTKTLGGKGSGCCGRKSRLRDPPTM